MAFYSVFFGYSETQQEFHLMDRTIILCCDDYSQNVAICEGILQLSHKKKINAISCLTNSAIWHEAHKDLECAKKTNYLGLHFNLTFGNALSSLWKNYYGKQFSGIGALLTRSYLKQWHVAAIEAEINAQLDAFTDATGIFPDFIDGHEHVHQLPVIRDTWLRIHAQRKLPSFFRSTSNGWNDFSTTNGFPKRQLIAFLGGITFKNRLKEKSIQTNTSFSGIYNFNNAAHYDNYFQRFLKMSHHVGLIMCHPGMQSNDHSDPLHLYRHHELNYFLSDQFIRDMKEHSFQLAVK